MRTLIYKVKTNRNADKNWRRRRRKSKPMNVCPTFWLQRADSQPADDESHPLSHGGKLIDISCLHTCSHAASGCAAVSPVIKIYLSFQGLRRWSEQQGGETRKGRVGGGCFSFFNLFLFLFWLLNRNGILLTPRRLIWLRFRGTAMRL